MDASKMLVSAVLYDTELDIRATHDYWWPRDTENSGIIYHWTEGNYGCDCNRSLFMGHLDEDLECNTGPNRITLERLTIDGVDMDLSD